MIESPVIQALEAEWKAQARAEARAEDVLRVLRARLGVLPEGLEAAVLGLRDEARLDGLLERAVRCETLEAFRADLQS